MELQRQILLFFCNCSNGLFDVLAQFFTLFGESVIVIVVCCFVSLCIDKKKGFSMVFSFLLANTVMNTLKAIIKFPRPWIVYPDITCKKISTATGYSFPSGHTVTAASMYGSASVLFRKKWISRISAVVILMVGISRMYLCCHWPLDVAGGLLLGLFFAFFVSPELLKLYENKKVMYKVFTILGILSLIAGLFVAYLIDKNGYDKVLYKDLTEGFSILGFGCISFAIEEKLINYKVEACWKNKIIRFLIAIAGALFFVVVMKKFVPDSGFMAWLRYGLALVWVFIGCPVLSIKLKIMDREND